MKQDNERLQMKVCIKIVDKKSVKIDCKEGV